MDNTKFLQELYAELADIERQQQDKTLSHSDQQLLDQAWEDVTNRIDELEAVDDENDAMNDWHDAARYLEEEDDVRPPTPIPPKPMMIAPPPPLLQGMTGIPPSIIIPKPTCRPTMAPPPPKASDDMCDCESDRMCDHCQDRLNQEEDARVGCRFCSGCYYCQDGYGYDGMDET